MRKRCDMTCEFAGVDEAGKIMCCNLGEELPADCHLNRTCYNCALIKTCGGKDVICFEHCTQEEHQRGMRAAMYHDNIALHRPR